MELNKIYNENCLDTLSKMPSDFIDLTVTSPPYDSARTYNGYSFEFEKVAAGLFRVTKPGGIVAWIVGDTTTDFDESLTPFKQALYFQSLGFKCNDTIIYQKNGASFPQANARYLQCFEYMFVFSKGKPSCINLIKDRKNMAAGNKITGTDRKSDGDLTKNCSGGRLNKILKEFGIRYNIWKYDVGNGKSYKDKSLKKHPAIFPEQLAADHIISWSNPGDLVYDPFSGSGTTAKMAKILGRTFLGSEISADYCEIANQRLEEILI